MRRVLGAPLILLGLTLAVVESGCAQEPSNAQAESPAGPSYELSANGGVEILTVRLRGGAEPLTSDYRLYGDGRLRREIVDKGREVVLGADEVVLTAEEMDKVIRPLADARLPELTRERTRQAAGGQVPVTIDGGYVIVQFQFERYERLGKTAEPLVTEMIQLPSPGSLAQTFPDFAEAKAAAALPNQLDAYFPQTVYQAINEAYQTMGTTGAQQ